MMSKHGKLTGEFGLWLSNYLGNNHQYSVYYDHGDNQKDLNVLAIKGFYGKLITNKNRLVDSDLIVVNNKNNSVDLLIEIEETEMSPKKLLGDVFTTLMCNQFAVSIDNEQKYFSLSPETHLIVAGVVKTKGTGQEKISLTITSRLQEFVVPGDSIQLDKVKFLFGNDISDTIKKLKSEMENAMWKLDQEKVDEVPL